MVPPKTGLAVSPCQSVKRVKPHVHVVILCHFMSFNLLWNATLNHSEGYSGRYTTHVGILLERFTVDDVWADCLIQWSWSVKGDWVWTKLQQLKSVCLRQQSQFDPSNTLAPLPTCGRICLWRHWDALSLNCTCNCLQANHLSLHLKCLHISTQKQGQKCGQDCKLKPSINTTSRISPKFIPRAWRTPFHGLQARQNTFYSIELCIPRTSLLAYINLSKLPIASSISTLVYLSYGLLLCTFHNMTIRCTTSRANKTSWGRYSRLRSRANYRPADIDRWVIYLPPSEGSEDCFRRDQLFSEIRVWLQASWRNSSEFWGCLTSHHVFLQVLIFKALPQKLEHRRHPEVASSLSLWVPGACAGGQGQPFRKGVHSPCEKISK